jgi:hypothetical protein
MSFSMHQRPWVLSQRQHCPHRNMHGPKHGQRFMAARAAMASWVRPALAADQIVIGASLPAIITASVLKQAPSTKQPLLDAQLDLTPFSA